MNLLQLARVIHAATLTYEQVVGELSQPWASRAVREETVELVKDIREASGKVVSEFWDEHVDKMNAQGWDCDGDKYSHERKIDPYLRYWSELTGIQRCKITMIFGMTLSLLSQVEL